MAGVFWIWVFDRARVCRFCGSVHYIGICSICVCSPGKNTNCGNCFVLGGLYHRQPILTLQVVCAASFIFYATSEHYLKFMILGGENAGRVARD